MGGSAVALTANASPLLGERKVVLAAIILTQASELRAKAKLLLVGQNTGYDSVE